MNCRGIVSTFLLVFALPAQAMWYTESGGSVEWEYRVSVVLDPAVAVNSMVRLDVDFSALLSTLMDTGTFDAASVRLVRSNGSLVAEAEFTDGRFAGVLDPLGNARGELVFIAQDVAAQGVYYLYFECWPMARNRLQRTR